MSEAAHPDALTDEDREVLEQLAERDDKFGTLAADMLAQSDSEEVNKS